MCGIPSLHGAYVTQCRDHELYRRLTLREHTQPLVVGVWWIGRQPWSISSGCWIYIFYTWKWIIHSVSFKVHYTQFFRFLFYWENCNWWWCGRSHHHHPSFAQWRDPVNFRLLQRRRIAWCVKEMLVFFFSGRSLKTRRYRAHCHLISSKFFN